MEMGAESSILDDCDLDEAVEDESCPWVLRNGQLADDTLITIFSDQNCDGPKRKLFQRNVKVMPNGPIYLFAHFIISS